MYLPTLKFSLRGDYVFDSLTISSNVEGMVLSDDSIITRGIVKGTIGESRVVLDPEATEQLLNMHPEYLPGLSMGDEWEYVFPLARTSTVDITPYSDIMFINREVIVRGCIKNGGVVLYNVDLEDLLNTLCRIRIIGGAEK